MASNEILEELYEARRQIMAQIKEEYGNDFSAYFRDIHERTVRSGHPIANLPQRRIKRVEPKDTDP